MAQALADGTGIPSGGVLLRFASAAHRDAPDLADARQAVVAAVGLAGLLEACSTVGVFNGLTRVADATGIALDGGTLAATCDVRVELGLNDLLGARNTGPDVHAGGEPAVPAAVSELFRD